MGSFVLKDGTGPAPSKSHIVSYPPKDAYFVHLTTGLNVNLQMEERGNYTVKDAVFEKLDSFMS